MTNHSYNFKDLTGVKFGRLIPLSYYKNENGKIYWICQCECGNIKHVSRDGLTSGNVVSCGCYLKERQSSFEDITNRRFGKLVALDRVQFAKYKYKWKCLCDCGNIYYATLSSLKSGKTTHCGCNLIRLSRRKDLTGMKFGKLTAIKPTEKRVNKSIVWECKCDCGNVIMYPVSKLTSSNGPKSCGCLKHESNKLENLSGMKFNRLTVQNEYIIKNNKTYWKCICDCGNEVWVQSYQLKNNKTRSCGCLSREYTIKRNISMRGENHGKWNNGSTYKDKGYCYKFARKSVKENVILFWDEKCVQCGRTNTENKELFNCKLTVHHVYENKGAMCDNTPKMLIPLCKSCHSKLNTTNKKYKKYCLNLYIQAIKEHNGKCMYTDEEYFKIVKGVDISR